MALKSLIRNLTIWLTFVSKRMTKPAIPEKKKIKNRGNSPQRLAICSPKKFPTLPCSKSPKRAINIIKVPKKTFASFRGTFILVNKKEVSSNKNGTKTEIRPNHSTNLRFRAMEYGPVWRKEKREIIDKTKKKIKKIVFMVSCFNLKTGRACFFLRPRLAMNTV